MMLSDSGPSKRTQSLTEGFMLVRLAVNMREQEGC